MGIAIKERALAEFVSANRLKPTWSGAEHVVLGRFGEVACFESDGGLLRLRLMAVPRHSVMSKALMSRRRAALTGGMQMQRAGEYEATLTFDPKDQSQAALAIKLVRARQKRRRVLSADQVQVLRDRLANHRQSILERVAHQEASTDSQRALHG